MTATSTERATRPAPLEAERAPAGYLAWMLGNQVLLELKLFWRNRASFFFGFLLPLLFLLFFGSLNRDARVQGHQYIDFFLPGMLGFTVVATALSNLAIALPIQRDHHILKRLRATPLPAPVFLGGKLLMATIVILLESALMLAVGRLFFGVTIPRDLASVALVLVAGAVVFSAIGFALAGLIPNGDSAPAIVNAVYLPMVFLGGAFFPTASMPRILTDVAQALPLTHFIALLRNIFVEGTGLTASPRALLVLAVWFVAATLVSLRTFKWVP
jgi:ABC-2 type transport system permease protein